MEESSQQRSAGPMRLPALFSNPFTRSSSVYSSRSPNPNLSTVNGPSTTPRLSFRGPFGWRRASPSVAAPPSPPPLPDLPRGGWTHPAAATGQLAANWRPSDQAPDLWPHPPRPLTPPPRQGSADSHGGSSESAATTTESERRRKREREAERRRRRRRHHQQRGWVRGGRRNASHRHSRYYGSHKPASGSQGIKLAAFAAGIFFVGTVTAYLSLALAVRGLGPELHILFAITILATLLFLVRAFFRIRAARRRADARRRQRAALRAASAEAHKAMRGAAGGFEPVVPIRVHLARDEEIVLDEEAANVDDDGAEDGEGRGSAAAAAAAGGLRVPPPAYGLWRSSVKVNPELLFWQRVDQPTLPVASAEAGPSSSGSGDDAARSTAPRPPSYISEDGVSYVVEAEPRSTVSLQRPPDQLHPAFRF